MAGQGFTSCDGCGRPLKFKRETFQGLVYCKKCFDAHQIQKAKRPKAGDGFRVERSRRG